MTLGYTNELADIRTHIWKNLAILRKNEEYCNAINSILSEVNYNRLNPWYTGNFDETYRDVVEGCEALFKKLQR